MWEAWVSVLQSVWKKYFWHTNGDDTFLTQIKQSILCMEKSATFHTCKVKIRVLAKNNPQIPIILLSSIVVVLLCQLLLQSCCMAMMHKHYNNYNGEHNNYSKPMHFGSLVLQTLLHAHNYLVILTIKRV